MNLNKILVFSYYHPWIAGGAHRPHQILIQDLLRGREVVFICTSTSELENAKILARANLYKKFALFYFDSINGALEPVTACAVKIAKTYPTLEDILNNWNPTYVRSHQPLESLIPFLDIIRTNNIPFLYDQMDYWAGFAIQPWGSNKIEEQYIEYADAITTISRFLENRFSHTGKMHFIPNAINPNFLSLLRKEKQNTITDYRNEIIYIGAMWPDWFDWDLVFYMIENRPNYSFTFIGPWETSDEDDGRPVYKYVERLKNYTNARLINEVPHVELIDFLCKSNVGIIPFVVNNVTIGCSPLKVFEYLGASLKVVSTALPEIANYPAVYVSDTYDTFLKNLDFATKNLLNKNEELIVRDFCEANTWVTQVDNLDKVIINIFNQKNKG